LAADEPRARFGVAGQAPVLRRLGRDLGEERRHQRDQGREPLVTRTLAILATAVAAASILAAADSGKAATAGCKSGVTTVDGSPARVFCGPAKASVRIGGKTLSFANGLCEQSGGGFVVNIGTFFPSSDTSKRPYLGLLVA